MKKFFSIAVLSLMGCKTLVVSPYIQTSDEGCPKVLMDGTSYYLSPCKIEITMIDGEGDIPLNVNIVTSNIDKFYKFSIYGYGEGFPTYAIIPTNRTRGAMGSTQLNGYFSDKIFNSQNGEEKTYTGRLPIKIQNHPSDAETKPLYLDLVVHVLPATK